jgi:hypothetical protein
MLSSAASRRARGQVRLGPVSNDGRDRGVAICLCPMFGQHVRKSDTARIVDEKTSPTTVPVRRDSAHGTSAANRVASWSAPLPISSRAASWLPSSVKQPARAGGALAFEALHARTRRSSQSRGSGARAFVGDGFLSGAPERDDPRDLGCRPIPCGPASAVLREWPRGPRRSWRNRSPPAPARHTDRPRTLRSRLAPRPRMRRPHRRR